MGQDLGYQDKILHQGMPPHQPHPQEPVQQPPAQQNYGYDHYSHDPAQYDNSKLLFHCLVANFHYFSAYRKQLWVFGNSEQRNG